jgi:hypothetical protein
MSLNGIEWKSDLEKWFNYSWDKHVACNPVQNISSPIRFELLPTSVGIETQSTATTEEITDQDDDPVWMKSDFPKGPWDDDPEFAPDGSKSSKPDEGKWIWSDIPPGPHDLDVHSWYVYDL